MRSIEARFQIREHYNVYKGSYLCLAEAVIYQGFCRKNLVKAFKKLVPKEEYDITEIKDLLQHLEVITNMPEKVENKIKNQSGQAEIGKLILPTRIETGIA